MLKIKPVFLLIIFAALIFASVPASAQDDSQTVPVEKGEILLYIAIRLDVSPECLRKANDLPSLMAVLDDVTELKIPSECASTITEAAASTTATSAPSNDAAVIADQTYTVERGDRLNKIAEQFGTTVGCIAETNNITNTNLIYVGQQLMITASCQGGGGGDAEADSAPQTGESAGCQFDRNSGRSAPDGQYTVQSGDSLDFIACDFGVSLECLTNANPQLDNRGLLAVGDTVTIDESCPGWTAWPGTGSADTP